MTPGVLPGVTPTVAAQDVIKQSPPYVLLLSGLGLLITLWKGATAFGLKPGEVLATMSNSVKIRDLSAQAGFRYNFGREFADVTWALRPRTLVLLIDDLDRCHPDHTMQVLETVNYLVSSGECVVVMGMATPQVVRCISHAFKELAEGEVKPATPGGEVPVDAAAAGQLALEEYARRYLEKIINIEVPVPVPTSDQARLLLVPEGEAVTQLDPAPKAASTAADVDRNVPAPAETSGPITRSLSGAPAFFSRVGQPLAAFAAIASRTRTRPRLSSPPVEYEMSVSIRSDLPALPSSFDEASPQPVPGATTVTAQPIPARRVSHLHR